MDTGKNVYEIFFSALRAVDPFFIVKENADRIYPEIINGKFKRVILAGFGKASFQMAGAVEESIGSDLITDGVVITKYGHITKDDARSTIQDTGKIRVFEAGHPIPDENGLKATGEAVSLLKNADRGTLVLCLISGGGSALLVSPYTGITLNEKQIITGLLLKSGADITELNAVRKHISGVKGGRLAEIVYPAKVISLIISDVIGDKLDVIASGPTSADNSTFQDAIDVIHKYNLKEKTPVSILETLKKGREGLIPETPKKNNPVFKNVQNIIIGSNQTALNAAQGRAQALGFQTEILSSEISGEARDVGKWLAEKAIKCKGTEAQRSKAQTCLPAGRGTKCLISGGETTVTVTGNGKGGRNTELALSFAREIQDIEGITLLSAGTDGTDGPTDAAGAIVDGSTIEKAKSLGLDPDEYLADNDSYNFFKKIDSLLITGPTGTNVMDVQIVLVE